MRSKDLSIFRLEDRILFDAAGATEVVEAAEAAHNDPNANVSETEKQAQEEKSAEVKDVQTDGQKDQSAGTGEAQTTPDTVADVNAQIDAIINGNLPDTGTDDDGGTGNIDVTQENAGSDSDSSDPSNDLVEAVLGNSDIIISTDRELVVINGTVPDKEVILAELNPNQDVLLLEDGNGLDELNEYLDEHADVKYSAIHLVTHGRDGQMTINGESITPETFHADDWTQIGEHLTDDGDILLYGCDTAKSADGQALVNKIADASGADVAASIDTTGLNGDWDLEYTTSGSVETAAISVDAYNYDLTTTITVSSNADSGANTLRQALIDAVSGDEINFTLGTNNTITLSDTIRIDKNITIDGANTDGENVILDGGNSVQIMDIATGKTVTLSNLTFQNGFSSTDAGAISNTGTLTVNNSTFSGNTATDAGGAIYSEGSTSVNDSTFSGNTAKHGGAIYFRVGTLTVNNSTFSGNTAKHGGAISNTGTLTVNNSTFSGNTATDAGGAIYNADTLMVANSTFSGNTAEHAGAIYKNVDTCIVKLVNNIIRGNGFIQIFGTLALDKYNISTGNITDIFENVVDGKAVLDDDGTFHIKNNGAAAWSGTKLQNNGGNLQYWDKETNKWANAGATTLTTEQLQVDQLGTPRTGTTGDYAVGAYFVEIEQETKSLVVTTANDVVNAYDGVISLREAINYAGTDGLGNNITFDTTAFGTTQTITLNSTLDIAKNITIDGIVGKVILDGGNTFTNGSSNNDGVRMMSINSGSTVTLSNLTFQNGYAALNGGGAIYINLGCKLTVNESIFNRNTAILASGTCGGGAIWNNSGTLTVNDSTFNDNTTNKTGGAIYSWGGTLTVNNSTFSGNSANTGGAIHSVARTNVNNSTFNNNRATANGGAIYNDYSGENRILTVTNSTFCNNSAVTDGDAIFNKPSSDVNLVNNIILGNGDNQISGTPTLDKNNITTGNITDIFVNVAAGKAVLDADGTFHIKNNGAAAWSGTKLQNNGGNLQYWDKETNNWANAGVTTTLTTEQLQEDQLGTPRTGTTGDYAVGAYFVEIEQETKSLVVTTANDVVNAYDGVISLREAINYAGTDGLGNVITFDATVFTAAPTITLNSTLAITKDITINGIGGKVILDGGNSVQIMNIASGKTVTLSNLTFQHGFALNGGAIGNASSLLTINGAKFTSNEATFGGAIYNIAGTVTVNQSLFSENRAYSTNEITSGGAIVSIPNDTTSGTLVVNSSTFSGNTSNSENNDAYGGAIGSAGLLTVINSTFSNNTAKTAGGAISVNDTNNGTVLVNSILIGNRKSSDDSVDDVSIPGGNASAYFCLLGNSPDLSGPSNTYSLSVDNVFYTLEGDSRAVLNADGTFHIKPKELVTNNGCKLQNADGNLQYWRKDTNSWANVYLFPRTMENPIQTALTTAELQTDQLGNNRTEHLVTPGTYSVGAVVLTDTASTIVTTGEDVDDPFDGLISLREAVEKYAQNNDAITFAGCANMNLNSEITVNKNITINGDITISTDNSDNVLFKAANGTEEITIGGLVRIENGDFKFGNGTITIQSGNNLVINNDSTLECASFLNNGTLYVKGSLNVVNSSAVVYTGNWGQVEYSSTSGQTVNAGTYSTLTFSGSGTKTLTGETTADIVAVKGAENSLITLEGNNKQLSVTTLCASWATIQNVNFAVNTTVNSWNNVIQSNTVDGSGNTNLTINLGGTFSTVSNELTYGENLKDNGNIKLIYSLRRQPDAELAVSTNDSLIYDKGTYTKTIAVSAAGYTFVNSTTPLLSLEFTVNSKTVPVDWIKDSSYTYNGNDQRGTVSASFKDINGISLTTLTITFTGTSGTFRNAGDYTATAESTNANYILDTDSASIQLVITPAMLTVETTAQSITYGESPDLTNYTVSGWIGSELEDLGRMSVSGTTSSSGFLTAGTQHEFDGSTLRSSSRNYSINFVTADVTVSHKQVTATSGSVITSKVYDGTRTAASSGNTVSGLFQDDNVSLNSAFLYNSANVAEATTISAAWTLDGPDAANYILFVNFVPVKGSITAKTVDVVWTDQAPYYVIGENQDQGNTISAKFITVNGSNVVLGIRFFHETAGETKFAQSGNYNAVAVPSADTNYILSEATASKAYSIGTRPNNPASDDQTQLWELNPNFDSTIPSLLGEALAANATTNQSEGNLYAAPYSTIVHTTDLLDRESRSNADSRISLRERNEIFGLRQTNRLFSFRAPPDFIPNLHMSLLNSPSSQIDTLLSNENIIVNEFGFSSGLDFTIERSEGQDLASDGIDFSSDSGIVAKSAFITIADNNDNSNFEFSPQPLKIPGSFFQKYKTMETTVLPDGYNIAGQPAVELPHRINRFKSEIELLIDEMLVTA